MAGGFLVIRQDFLIDGLAVRSDNGLGDRMGRTALRKRGPFQKLFLGNILCRDTCGDRKTSLGQGSGLVEGNNFRFRQRF